ncbi:penicillin-binding protein 2 [Desulfitobacterium sp. AusDCA]|uniref:penicillin-binding protein 2 n=1 Tax=Desulfitobacterium sp. AusDCA TaxID=3240383 RepID=UPI003DA6FB60
MDKEERKKYQRRLSGLITVVICVFLILGWNLWRIQIAKGAYYSSMVKGNATQLVSIPATRGDIVDKNGKLLATSTPEYDLTLDWMSLQNTKNVNLQDIVRRLAGFIKPYWTTPGETEENITEDILAMIQNQGFEHYRPVTILSNVNDTLQAEIADHSDELPGVSIEANPVRSYSQGVLAGQVLGYVHEISQAEISQFNQNPAAQKAGFTYAQGDNVGKMGVEKSYDFWLRGQDGVENVEVDGSGKPVNKEIVQQPVPGKTIQLTIDSDLQQVVESSLNNVIQDIQKQHPEAKEGAAVAIDVNTGKILAMASEPAMNPNDLIGSISQATANQYFQSSDAASFNRAISGVYPPGSTFKMVTAMAALQSKATTPEESIPDVISSLGPLVNQQQGFPEWGGHNFGPVNLFQAIADSSDIYFQVMGQRVFDSSPELVKQIANEFGLGETSGVDLPGEAKGIAPSPQWKQDYYTPYYKQLYDKKIAAINSKYTAEMAKAADQSAKQKLQKAEDTEKNQADAEYKSMIAQNVQWHLYDSYNNAIGQGYNDYTPLQLANYVATLVNGGIRYQPYIVDKIVDPLTGKTIQQNNPTVINHVSVSPDILATVKQAMSEVTSGGGTANFLFADVPEFSGGAKTGTAQIGSKNTLAGDLYNGMFVAFAPYDHPQIAFAGVVNYGEHGGDSAGLVAKAAFMKYFGWKSTNGG